ncbi:MAG TPA: hypothetical protein VN256_13135 [Pyrinomonadaceae bacterium]|nr:hypothetical protein [Pyrinomonadaceae bacterium]
MPDERKELNKTTPQPQESDRMSADKGNVSKSEIEVLERKTKAMIALGHEILNRLQELKAA